MPLSCGIEAFLLTLEARLAAPGAHQGIADFEGKPPEAIDLELDMIFVLERMQAAVVGAAGQNVA